MAESKSLAPSMARYEQRERSPIGRVINDISDRAQDLSNSIRTAINVRRGNETPEAGRALSQSIADGRADKAEWRQAFKETGILQVPNAPRDIRSAASTAPPMAENPGVKIGFQGSRFEARDTNLEARALIGKSSEGFHAGVQVSVKGGETRPAVWSGAMKSERAASEIATAEVGRILGMPVRRVESAPQTTTASAPAQGSDIRDIAAAKTTTAANSYRMGVSAAAAPASGETQKANSRMKM